MKKTTVKRALALATALLCAVCMAVSAIAADVKPPERPVMASYTPNDLDYVSIGADGPVEIRVYPSGAFGVYMPEHANHPAQYYSYCDYGSIWFVNDNRYHTKYLSGGGIAILPDELGSLGTGTLTQNGRTATVTWEKDGLVFSTSYTVQPGSRTVTQSWGLTNNTGEPIQNARLIAGGDTYFEGDDYGYAYWSDTQGICVYRDADSGLMAFMPITPQSGYFAGHYSEGKGRAESDTLNNTADPTYVDQSYYLQWDYSNLANGATGMVYAQQSFAEADIGIAGTPPPSIGSSVTRPGTIALAYTLTNVTNAPITVALSAVSQDGDIVSFTNPDAPAPFAAGDPEITIGARQNQDVPVYVTVGADATLGTHTVLLTATNTENSLSTTIPASFTVNAPQGEEELPALVVETDANLLQNGDSFYAQSYFVEEVRSNVVILNYTFDTAKFSYEGFTPSAGTGVVLTDIIESGVSITLMIPDYNAKDLGRLLLSVKEEATLQNEDNEILLALACAIMDEDGNKQAFAAQASTSFTTFVIGEVTLIDLSNLIDVFGIDSTHPEWNRYRFFDFNGSGTIDIFDIAKFSSYIL